ncbi:MAG TPA: M28 family peptidase [Bryobacteraceae bacterium]|nr:M28 family peptidase [Bryobacteraceae bacterium]
MRTKSINIVMIAAALAFPLAGQQISAERIRAHTKFLASDYMEGRGVGARGGDLATEYLATAFAVAGALPAGENGTYFQRVPLVGVETQPGVQLSAVSKGKTVPFRWAEDFVGLNHKQQASGRLTAEAVFVGHGISAPEFQWDDYKGTDVRGKVVVLFTNEPPSEKADFFGGRALTYYGRWTYKYEEALRRGAAGAIIIHTTPTAGYGWDVVRNSWGHENPFVKLAPNEAALAFAGWVTREAGEKLLGLSGRNVESLLKAAESRDFKPIPLNVRINAVIPSKVRQIDTRNVAAVVPGSDPELKKEAVVFTAHWDHLGIGTPVDGDAIYNGAVDNATGCAMLIEMARAWAELPQKPRRSALFLAVTAEEGGLRGSEFYANHPIFPAGKTAAAFNFDAIHPYGRTKDVVLTGAERTTLWPVVEAAANRMGLVIKPDPRPEQGSYYRSDHFSMATVGIPAFTVEAGSDVLGKPPGFADQLFREFNARHYHQPSDEFHDDWDFSGLEQMARFGILIALDTANQDALPTWRAGDEFLPARQKSGVK